MSKIMRAETEQRFPEPALIDKLGVAFMASAMVLGGLFGIEALVEEDTRCISDQPGGTIDFNPVECVEVVEDFLQ